MYSMEVSMTEREKMLAGELYDCGDPELLTNKKGSILVEPFLLFPNIVPIRFFTSSHC